MNKLRDSVESFLDNECDDYGLSYNIIDEHDNHITAKIERNEKEMEIRFRMSKNNILEIEMGEGSWRETEYFDWTVRYFWMLICPVLFT